MNCPICGETKQPTDSLESPISGGTVSPDYECPNNCEYLEWLEKQNANKKNA